MEPSAPPEGMMSELDLLEPHRVDEGWFDVDGERRYCYLTESGLMRIYFEPLMKDLFVPIDSETKGTRPVPYDLTNPKHFKPLLKGEESQGNGHSVTELDEKQKKQLEVVRAKFSNNRKYCGTLGFFEYSYQASFLFPGNHVIGNIKKAPRRNQTFYASIIMFECRLGNKETSAMEEEGTEMGETEVLVANFYTVSTSNGKQMKKWMEAMKVGQAQDADVARQKLDSAEAYCGVCATPFPGRQFNELNTAVGKGEAVQCAHCKRVIVASSLVPGDARSSFGLLLV